MRNTEDLAVSNEHFRKVQHVKILHDSGLIARRQEGDTDYCSIDHPGSFLLA